MDKGTLEGLVPREGADLFSFGARVRARVRACAHACVCIVACWGSFAPPPPQPPRALGTCQGHVYAPDVLQAVDGVAEAWTMIMKN